MDSHTGRLNLLYESEDPELRGPLVAPFLAKFAIRPWLLEELLIGLLSVAAFLLRLYDLVGMPPGIRVTKLSLPCRLKESPMASGSAH